MNVKFAVKLREADFELRGSVSVGSCDKVTEAVESSELDNVGVSTGMIESLAVTSGVTEREGVEKSVLVGLGSRVGESDSVAETGALDETDMDNEVEAESEWECLELCVMEK